MSGEGNACFRMFLNLVRKPVGMCIINYIFGGTAMAAKDINARCPWPLDTTVCFDRVLGEVAVV